MNKIELYKLYNIVLDWMYEVDRFADGMLSTKYSRLQDEMRSMLEFIVERIEEM
jgi:hypothetical protein